MNLDETLRALRESAAMEVPSTSLELSLLRQFRSHQRQKRRRQMWIGIGAGVAASLLIALALKPEHPPAAAKITPRVPVLSAPPQPVVAVAAAVQPQRRPISVRHKPAAKPPQPTPEVATDFIPIPYAPGFHAEDSAAIVRMELPRYSLQTVGLPFNPERANERIDADVLMGQDGIARAIRFVH